MAKENKAYRAFEEEASQNQEQMLRSVLDLAQQCQDFRSALSRKDRVIELLQSEKDCLLSENKRLRDQLEQQRGEMLSLAAVAAHEKAEQQQLALERSVQEVTPPHGLKFRDVLTIII